MQAVPCWAAGLQTAVGPRCAPEPAEAKSYVSATEPYSYIRGESYRLVASGLQLKTAIH